MGIEAVTLTSLKSTLRGVLVSPVRGWGHLISAGFKVLGGESAVPNTSYKAA